MTIVKEHPEFNNFHEVRHPLLLHKLSTLRNHRTNKKEFKELAAANKIKPGDVLMPLRVMLVGGKFGPGVFEIAALLGKEETIERIKKALNVFGQALNS